MAEYIKIKDMHPEERPYEKCEKYGAEALTEVELLAAIIKTGVRGASSTDLAREIISMTGEKKIAGIARLSLEELMTIKGIGKVKAIQIMCIAELSRRIAKSRADIRLRFDNPETIADYYMEDLRHKDREYLVLIMLDSKCRLISEKTMTVGTVNASLISAREIYIEAVKKQAVNIVLLHNHPSGDSTPSTQDIYSTKKVIEAGRILGISLIDHIIIGDNNYVSLKERGIID